MHLIINPRNYQLVPYPGHTKSLLADPENETL